MLLIVSVVPIFATTAYGSGFNFAVESIIPDNQINPQVTWFNLLVEPGDEQTLAMNLRNDTNEDVIVEVEIAVATTNLNGIVEYVVRDVERDSTLVHDLADLVTVPDTIVVPANGSAVLEMELSVPNEDFEGLIAGGITFRKQELEEEGNVGMMIRNRVAYVIAMTLQTDEEITAMPDFTVNDARAGHLNARNVIFVNVQNTQATFVTWVSLNARVYRRGETAWHWNEVTPPRVMMFAPNSNMDFPIRLDGQPVEAGEYTACVTVTSEAFEEDMVWEDLCVDFTITSEEAEELNRGDVEIPELDNTGLIIALVALAVVILLLLAISLILKRRNNNDDEYESDEDI